MKKDEIMLEIEGIKEERDELLKRIERSSPGNVDSVYQSLTHPYSNDAGDVRAYMWLLSQAIQVPILIREIELLKMEIEGMEAGLKKMAAPEESTKPEAKAKVESKKDSEDKVAKLLDDLDAKAKGKDNK